ncbi:MAG TPA: bifunctional phosphoglucose/phosphomannose isomerase, partial [Candidatus Omnitrophica bacterium]|nr:bifunctional phosphoglucose/phosphomannose isomerase [Candidatus Omnitrophota bacterium]
RIPLIVNRSYTLPRLVNKESLLICVSYSGNTEETLSAYTIGKKRGSRVVVISSGGELTSLAKEDGFPHIMVPSGMPPRTALGYLFFSQLFLLKTLGFVSVEDKELEETVQTLTSLRREIDVQTPKDENMAKKLAEKIYDTVVLIYTTSDFLEGVGVRWKTQINENSKNPAYYEFFPELDHNEIMGWEGVPEGVSERFSLILLRDRGESERMVKRINITSELIKERISRILEVTSRGEGLLSRIFSLIYIGDYVSFYLAILKGVDPTEIRSIDRLKRRMKE